MIDEGTGAQMAGPFAIPHRQAAGRSSAFDRVGRVAPARGRSPEFPVRRRPDVPVLLRMQMRIRRRGFQIDRYPRAVDGNSPWLSPGEVL